MPILGLISTESFANERFKNIRRRVFHNYPNGKAPLIGLLSLMQEQSVKVSEPTDDPEFSWWEDRMIELSATTASQGSSKGPFMTEAGVDAGDPFTWTAGTVYRIVVDSTALIRVGHIVMVNVTRGANPSANIRGIVTELTSSTVIKVKALETVASIDNGTTNENVGKRVLVIGHAAEQGAGISGQSIHLTPSSFYNYCGISRTHFEFTGTALKTSLMYDQSGPYRERAKKAALEHMTNLERTFLFGVRQKFVSNGRPTYTTGGVMWFLEQWEAANSPYRGGTGAPAITSDSDDNKRIIENASGVLTEKLMDTYMERLFRVTNNQTNEKLALCGNVALTVINQLFRSKGVLQLRQASEQTYGMDIVSHMTPFGTVHYKTHPLFNLNPEMRSWILFLDITNLRYRYVEGRDTTLLKNRNNNDEDVRRDEFLTECGLELHFPESHMLIKNVLSAAP